MERVKCATCGKEKDYNDFPVHEKYNLIEGESVCSDCSEEHNENYSIDGITTGKSKNSMASFLIAGIIGSSIFGLIISLGIAASLGIFSLVGLLIPAPFGLLGGFAGYRLFKLLNSTSSSVKSGLTLVTVVLGFGLSLLFYILQFQ